MEQLFFSFLLWKKKGVVIYSILGCVFGFYFAGHDRDGRAGLESSLAQNADNINNNVNVDEAMIGFCKKNLEKHCDSLKRQ